jgi:nucleoid DNA-binding protein
MREWVISINEKLECLTSKPRMDRKEIALKLSLQLGLTPKKCLETLDTLTSIIEETLKGGRNVCIYGFGTFEVEQLPAGKVRNPQVAKGPLAFKEVGPRKRFRWRPGTTF